MESLDSNLFAVRLNKKFGLIDTLEQEIMSCNYYDFRKLSDSVYIAQKASMVQNDGSNPVTGFSNVKTDNKDKESVYPGKYFLINRRGQPLYNLEFTEIGQRSWGNIQIKLDRMTGLIDSNGAILLPPRFVETEFFRSGYIKAREYGSGYWGLWHDGHAVIPNKYKKMGTLRDNWVWTFDGQEFAFLNHKGENLMIASGEADKSYPLLPKQVFSRYELFGITPDDSGLIRVRKNGQWGWINAKGTEVIACRFAAATPFSNGKARVFILPFLETEINLKGDCILGSVSY